MRKSPPLYGTSFTWPSPTTTAAQLLVVPRSMPMMVSGGSIGGRAESTTAEPPGWRGPPRPPEARRSKWRYGRSRMASSPDARRWLAQVGGGVRGAYAEQRSLLSFEEYLEVFLAAPRVQARNSAQVLRDVVDHFGWREVPTPAGPARRARLFDLEFEPDARAVRVAGQEE